MCSFSFQEFSPVFCMPVFLNLNIFIYNFEFSLCVFDCWIISVPIFILLCLPKNFKFNFFFTILQQFLIIFSFFFSTKLSPKTFLNDNFLFFCYHRISLSKLS